MSTLSVGPPKQSYIIWFSQRVGSTMLTQALEDTSLAGHPREWLNAGTKEELLAAHGASNADALRQTLWLRAATANGVLGVKYGMTESLHGDLTSLFSSVLSQEGSADGRAAWEAFFPRCQHIFMTRRDKLRLAVSWWRAITSEEWHRPNRAHTVVSEGGAWVPPLRPNVSELAGRYDYDAIHHLLTEASLREAAMQEQFNRWGVIPYTIVYEDLIASYEETIRGVLHFLRVSGVENVSIPSPAFDRIADETSESWYQRFSREHKARAAGDEGPP